MLPRARDGYTQDPVDAALTAKDAVRTLAFQYDLLDLDGNVLRTLQSVTECSIHHQYDAQIKRSARFDIRKSDIALKSYKDQIVSLKPVAYWRLGELSGTVANDSSGNGRSGTYTNGVTLGAAGLLANDTDTAASLDGTNDFITVADDAGWDVTAITVEAWINTTRSGAQQEIVSRNDGTNKAFRLLLLGDGTLHAVLDFTTGAEVNYNSGVAVNDGNLHHCVLTYDGSFVKLYVDSIRVLKTAETRAMQATAIGLTFGARSGPTGNFFQGTIDEIAFYDRALTAAEIRLNYQTGIKDASEIDFTRDRIKVYEKIKIPDDGNYATFPRGVFVLSTPRTTIDDTGTEYQVDAFDQSVILSGVAADTRYTIASGTNYISAVATLLTTAGFTQQNLQPTSLTLAATRDWPIGTSYLQIVNDLLAAIGYRSLYFDSDGIPTAVPYVLPASRTSEYTYSDKADGVVFPMVLPGMEVVNDTFDTVPNIVTLYVGEPDRATLTSTQKNNRIDSPASIIRRAGRKIPYQEKSEAPNQTTLDTLAKQRLTELSQYLQNVTFATPLMPFHEDYDFITLVNSRAGLSFNYVELEWEETLSEDPSRRTMRHVAQRGVEVV